MHLGDGIIIFVIALILFGPKKLPEMARQVAKLMAEFRRASNEFKTQIDEELRSAEQADRQKQISAAAAASPAVTPPPTVIEPTILPPSVGEPVSQFAYYDPESQRPDRSLDSGTQTPDTTVETISPPLPDAAAASVVNEDAVSHEAGLNGNVHENQGGGLAALFAGRDRSTDITYHPDNAGDGPEAVGEDLAEGSQSEKLPPPLNFADRNTDLVEGTAAEQAQAQASVHHV